MAFGWTHLGICVSAALLLGASAAACSAGNDETKGGGGSGNTSSTGGNTTSSGTGGGETGGAGGSGGDINLLGGQGQGGQEECLLTEAEAQRKTLNIVVALDRSGSMGTKWDQSVAALTTFYNDPNTTGTNVAMNFFPSEDSSLSITCNPANYNPVQEPFTAIPGSAQSLIDAMNAKNDTGPNTPTYGVLLGTLQVATAYQDLVPDEIVIVVFASDGDPCCSSTDCTEDMGVISALAQSAYNYNGVKTYVIAIQGSVMANLNQIAAAGGTGQAFDVTSDITLFSQKMEEIRADALGCEYTIPDPGNGEFEPTKLNVNYTPGGTNTPIDIPQAESAADCGNQPGWYYDDNVYPTKVYFCPATCTEIQADSQAKVDFLFGCPTIVN